MIDTRQPLDETVAQIRGLLDMDGFSQHEGGRDGQKIEGPMTYEQAVAAIPPGRYRHFKGNEYEVLHIARHSETEAPMVVYRALYGDFGVWVRPASMWCETVERDGRSFTRFARVEA